MKVPGAVKPVFLGKLHGHNYDTMKIGRKASFPYLQKAMVQYSHRPKTLGTEICYLPLYYPCLKTALSLPFTASSCATRNPPYVKAQREAQYLDHQVTSIDVASMLALRKTRGCGDKVPSWHVDDTRKLGPHADPASSCQLVVSARA